MLALIAVLIFITAIGSQNQKMQPVVLPNGKRAFIRPDETLLVSQPAVCTNSITRSTIALSHMKPSAAATIE